MWVSWENILWGFGYPNDTQTPCWLRLCLGEDVEEQLVEEEDEEGLGISSI